MRENNVVEKDNIEDELLWRYVPQLLSLFRNSNYIFLFLDEEYKVFYANNGARRFFERFQGINPEGRGLFEVFPELDSFLVKYHLENGMTYQTKYFYSWENKLRVLILRFFRLTEDGKVFLLFGQDITDFLRLTLNIELTPKFDKKTGLLNLLPFLDTVQGELFSLLRCAKNGLQSYAGVFVLDLYNFSVVNNLYGRQVGDEILREIAQRLVRIVGKERVGRGAADEFVLFISGLSRKEDVSEYLKAIDFVFELPFYINEKKIRVHYNLGVAIYPCDGEDAEVLFQKARLACNLAKKRGLNQVMFFEEGLSEEMQRRLFIENLLGEAIKNDWFIFFVQPYFEMGNFELAGVEALVRIRTIDGCLFFPGDFIAVLEASPFYLRKFEDLAFEKVIALQKDLKLPVSLNLSSSTFCEIKFFEDKQEKIEALEYPLILEITERGAIENPHQVKETLNFLKKFPQLKIAIDDFGRGYNGLVYLKDVFEGLEGVIIKIDKSFVWELSYKNSKVIELIGTIINLAHNLGAKTLAEGVETEEQVEILCSLGCNYLQGFYFEKPIPVEVFVEKYKKGGRNDGR